MAGMVDHRFPSYSHGIVSQDCLAKQFLNSSVTVRLIITGTFVKVHSIRDDDVLFCIVHDDMQMEMNQMMCKKADIINVPENLWGPLFTVKKVERLSLVKDSKIAESIANISLGHTVQVLGPDNSVVCTANVTFRNSIGSLGVGIYFGLQVLSPRENLSAIIKKVSLLMPGTKGFPRGCDVVVTVDKILPNNHYVNVEKSVWSLEKEKSLGFGEDGGDRSCKAVSGCWPKDKVSNNCQKVLCDEGIFKSSSARLVKAPEIQFSLGDEVALLNGDKCERGVVECIIRDPQKVGLKFDNPIVEETDDLIRTNGQFSDLVSPKALVRYTCNLKYYSKEEKVHFRKSNGNSNNNTSVSSSAKNKNNDVIKQIEYISPKSDMQQTWKSFNIPKPMDKKNPYRRNRSSVDNCVDQVESPSSLNGGDLSNFPLWDSPQETPRPSCCSDLKVHRDAIHQEDKWGWQPSGPSNSDEHPISRPSHPDSHGWDLEKGSVVELPYNGEPHYGVIRWIGTLAEKRADSPPLLIAGVEMEEECEDFTDGTLNNKRYFQCNPRKGLFVPLRKCKKDSRFLEESHRQSFSSKVNYGQIDCPVVEGRVPPINTKDDIESICGRNKGIQGHHNSCYLDATLFSMFAFTSVFDSLLYRPPTARDIPQYNEVQRVLREEIVNPLRKNLYVRADRVMKLRTLMEELSSISGLTSEEKDPEEFLNSLLAQVLRAEPFLKLSSGQEAFHYQLFVEKDERLTLPSVQLLFEQSFVTSGIKLKQVPSCLIIQMPRFGKSFKVYSKILPPQLLDITDIIENSPRQCTVCGKLAECECRDCFGQQGIGNGLESISYCKPCFETAHNHHCRSSHHGRALSVPLEFDLLREHCAIPRLFMELFAVVCIETSHYVAFVKCGSGSDAPWCFFDSMADRKGEQNGYNIPVMVPCPDLPYWLSEEGAKALNEMQDERQLPEHAKRLFSDAYMCMYQSPDLMMYR